MASSYQEKAQIYAESYGIITYHLEGNKMIYYQNYREPQYNHIKGKWEDNPTTYKRIVNLDTYDNSTEKLQRLNKEGWDNV